MISEKLDEKEIFNVARKIDSPDARAEYLHQVCGADQDLFERENILLRAYEGQASFLESPPADSVSPTIDRPITETLGTVIGPYKLLQQIGEGGMGVVFMAEQTEPIQRTVALKIIKPGMDTRQVIARFEAERQAVAMMDHPNIAKVLDAGTTDSGRPYFVMELVKGVSITKYSDEKRLPLRARLELFVQVCQAVQHAHQKGIIHRDIKPNNVLVSEYDNRAVPKVIDFGVAKATAQRLTERTMFTEFGQVLGTMEYMSPEQSKFNQLDIDTRSDIYSLGVLLYELLAGSTPFEGKRLHAAAFDEMLRIIREEEPPKPSTRLSSIDTLPSVAINRHTEPARLSKDVRGELDWVVMKALEKDRNRRYETASGFARDIERHLHDEPVHASPSSTAYRVRKLIRRNMLPVAATAALMLTLTLGIAGTTWQSIRATRASALARQEADKLQAINQFLREMLQSANPWARTVADSFKGRDATVVQMCDAAVARLDAGALKDRPEVEAALRATIGETYGGLERGNEGEVQLREAVRLARLAYGPENPEQPGYTVPLATNLFNRKVKLDEAEALMRDRLRIRKKLHPDMDFSQGMNTLAKILLLKWQYKRDASSLTEAEQIARQIDRPLLLADVLHQQGKLAEAEALRRKALADAPQRWANKPMQLAGEIMTFARLLNEQGKRAEAETNFREALRIAPDWVAAKGYLARCLWVQGKYSEAGALYREAMEQQRINRGDNSPAFIQLQSALANVLVAEGKMTEAEALFRQLIEKQPNSAVERWNRWARYLVSHHKLAEAVGAYTEVIRLTADDQPAWRERGDAYMLLDEPEKALADENRAVVLDPTDASAWQSRALVYMRLRQFERALSDYNTSIGLNPDEPQFLFRRADCWSELGEADKSYEDRANAIALHEKNFQQATSNRQGLRSHELAWALATVADPKLRDPKRAVELAQKAVELRPADRATWNTLGTAHYRAGDFNAAMAALEKSRQLGTGGDVFNGFVLAMAHWQLGHHEDARKWYDQAVASMEKNQPHDEQLRRFRAEAEELLKITDQKPTTNPPVEVK